MYYVDQPSKKPSAQGSDKVVMYCIVQPYKTPLAQGSNNNVMCHIVQPHKTASTQAFYKVVVYYKCTMYILLPRLNDLIKLL